ncbi:spore germination protein [Alkalibacillus sp. S2W]|uniref:spore germination protein n=1 Tax=Alkalibacillus sp. S2W TaxID=3386553 RepID=UPI00398CCBAE
MKRRFRQSSYFPCKIETLQQDLFTDFFNSSPDLASKTVNVEGKKALIIYMDYLVREEEVYNHITSKVQGAKQLDYQTIESEVPVTDIMELKTLDEIGGALLEGYVCVYIEKEKHCIVIPVPRIDQRKPAKAETESLIFGPQISFSDSIDVNMNFIHKRLDTKTLTAEKFIIGDKIPSEVRLIYLSDIANDEAVQEMRSRLNSLQVDDVLDSSALTQYVEDNSYSIFPQFLVTELPDRFCYSLKEGRVGLLVDKSPSAVIAPVSFLSFFQTTEDIYTRWNMGSFIRLMRLVGMFLSITLTPLYVAALTYHYEIIPDALLVSLGHSRSRVPFPPLLEALILEFLIELIREAGARLPTKVGQTMGIVGGIVVGQAVVQAGFTSNILIIIVALSALASFTAPSYLMGSAIRILRFPLIILAGFWGFLGIMFSFAFITIHLIRQRSLNFPYFVPIYPFQPRDLDNSFIRLPFLWSYKRAYSNRPKKIRRFKKPNR